MLPAKPKRIAVIGGGFSGIVTAVNLARFSPRPLHLTVVNPGNTIGRGAAYGSTRREHVLNVTARNMSAFPEMPEHFLQWLRNHEDYKSIPDSELKGTFVPRLVYGDYLHYLIQQHLHLTASISTDFVQGEAIDMDCDDQEATVHLRGRKEIGRGSCHPRHRNESPTAFPGSDGLTAHRGWVANPWQNWEERLPSSGG